MLHRLLTSTWIVVLVAVAALLSTAPLYAQGGATSTIAGTVMDSSGAVVPGVDIVVKNNATGVVFTAVSGDNGTFGVPAVPPGTYTITVKLMGFKTTILNDVVANVAQVATVKAVLDLGTLEETVIVSGASEIVQTQSTSVATTLTVRQIASLPLPGRGAFDLVSFMPGVSTTTGGIRDATVNGLPQSAVNITLDGMNIQDNYAKTWDGMFTRVSPRLDAVEEVTISTAAQGADMGSQGAAQVRFVTRSGTNKYQGSAYFYYRRGWMNSNTWFNLHRNVDATTGKPTPTPRIFQDQPGGRIGGPIIKDKAFFFFNYEWISSPGSRTDNRTIMSPLSEQGIFQYGGGRTVDLMALAASRGQTARIDPTVAKLLADVRSSTAKGTVTTTIDPLTQTFAWSQDTKGTTKYPTGRLDYNVTSKHRISLSGTHNQLLSTPDTTNSTQAVYPGFPVHGLQDSARWSTQFSIRSTLTPNMVNELRLGGTGGATKFSPNLTVDMYDDPSIGNMKGYAIAWSAFKSISNPFPQSTNSAREGSTRVIENTLNWLKGKHSLSIGASATRGDVWLQNQRLVPTATLGMASGDPADSMFTSANFPGASSTDLTNAKNLYAVLTGRITSLTRDARIAEDGKTFNILGKSMQKGRMWQVGAFVQDGWRWRSNLTINAGLRYEVQLPFYALNNSYSMATMADVFGPTGTGSGLDVGSTVTGLGNLFKPGTLEGAPTTYKMLEKNSKAFNTDWNNLAPSIGAAWTTGAESGLLHTLLGSKGATVVRGGYNISYQRGGMSDFTEVYGDNPGILIDATRNLANGNLGTLPVLLTGSDLGAPPIPLERVYPMAVPSASSNVRAFDPDIKLPFAGSGTIGIQRALAKNLSIEARYIRTDSWASWTLRNLSGALNYNEINIVENGFLQEFRVAQANLVANLAAGRGNTFAFTGVPGTSPLPIFLANLSGSSAANDTTKYTGSGWTNSTLVQSLYALNPNPQTAASNMRTNATYRSNMVNAGFPVNFWVVNPYVNNSTVVTNGPKTKYNAVQFIVNRRYAQGFQVQASYTYGKGYQSDFYSFRKPYVEREQNYSNGSASLGNVRHNLAVNWLYELPFGRSKRFASNAGGVLDRVIGNWSIMGTARVQSGRMVDFGNVRLVGFTKDELQKMTKIRMTTDANNPFRTLVWTLPQDIIDNTVKAFSVTATGYGAAGAPTGRYFAPANGPDCLESVTGYGDCGSQSVIITGPKVIRVDLTFAKRVAIVGPLNMEFQAMMFNVFNRVNFNPINYIGSTTDSYQTTSAVDQARTMQLALRVTW
jgi:hypothetical protein